MLLSYSGSPSYTCCKAASAYVRTIWSKTSPSDWKVWNPGVRQGMQRLATGGSPAKKGLCLFCHSLRRHVQASATKVFRIHPKKPHIWGTSGLPLRFAAFALPTAACVSAPGANPD